MSYTAFFYGTLMFPPVLYRVIYGSSNPEPWQRALTTLRPAILHGFQRHRVKSADYPAISPSSEEGACVRGTVVTGLTEGDLYRLDWFEGDEYARKTVKAKVLKGKVGPSGRVVDGGGEEVEEVEAITYVWCSDADGLEQREWDFEEFATEKSWRWVGSAGAAEYAEVDEAVKAQENDPTGGRGPDGTISRTLEEQRAKQQDDVPKAD